MHGDLIGVVFSVLLISIGYVIHEIIRKKDDFTARKFLHIWSSNWYFVYACMFDTPWAAIAGLFGYAVFNFILEIKVYKTHKYGTVIYPLSIITMVLLQYFGIGNMTTLGCGILAMGYGDGLAAIVGKKTSSPCMPFVKNKTVLGSFTLFAVAGIVVFLVSGCTVAKAALIGFIASVCEAYMPFGLDNISVPLVVYLLVNAIC